MMSRPRFRSRQLLRRFAMVVMVILTVGGRSGMADEEAVTRNAARVQQLEQAMPVGPRSAK
ncbi:MAG: hypothetical protein QGG74_01895, partial [Phycisphaerales bacterium]|nr:hypothetical protein [Phycisphaerales bacterium]